MSYRISNSKPMLAMPLMLLFSWHSLSAQQFVQGKLVKTGIWQGRQIEYLEREIAVILEPGVSIPDVIPVLENHGAIIKRDFDFLGWGLIELPDAVDVLTLAAELTRNPLIKVAEPNMVDRTGTGPDDSFYQDGHQWGLTNTGQDPPGGGLDADIFFHEAWQITSGSSSVIIAILDSGIPLDDNGNLSHLDLDNVSKFILGPDYVDDGEGVRDRRGHGTHVTGIAAAETDNTVGIAGVCGACRVMIIQVTNQNGRALHEDFKDGVIYASNNGALVINYSSSGPPSSTKELAINWAHKKDVLIVSSSGNDSSYVRWPAAYSTTWDNVIAVGATDHNDVRAAYSNFGPELNVIAPGGYGGAGDPDDIWSTTPDYPFTLQNGTNATENYSYFAGTSMAAPHVSGVAGLILSWVDPNFYTASDIRGFIEQSADKVDGMGGQDFTNYYGYGRVNAFLALSLADGPPVTPTGFSILGSSGQNPTLSWNANSEPDLKQYNIYRKVPGSSIYTFLASTTGTQYTDNSVTISRFGDPYCYKIDAEDHANQKSAKTAAKCVDGQGPVGKVASQDVPGYFVLHSNFPNPFNPVTTIKYDLPEESFVSLKVYDLMGHEIVTLVNGNLDAGYKNVIWDGKDFHGNSVSSGVYLYRLIAVSRESDKEIHQTRKMVLLR